MSSVSFKVSRFSFTDFCVLDKSLKSSPIDYITFKTIFDQIRLKGKMFRSRIDRLIGMNT